MGIIPQSYLMNARSNLIDEIQSFSAKYGIAETSIGSFALKDSRFVGRLRAGGGVSLRSVEKLHDWLRSESLRRSSLRLPDLSFDPNDKRESCAAIPAYAANTVLFSDHP